MNDQLLKTTTDTLPFSNELKSILTTNGIENLEDLLQLHIHQWHRYPGFNYHHQHQIVKYLEKNNLMRYLKEE